MNVRVIHGLMEEWKDIISFEGLYQVSNHGRIRSMAKCIAGTKRCFPERLMKLHVHTNGYQVVWLRRPKVHQKFYVHRIVASHFLELVDGKDYVNHKDKDRFNNAVGNLEWCTHEENVKHRDTYGKTAASVSSGDEINADDIPF